MSDWHKFMTEPPADFQVFIQPSGMSPQAENLNHLLQTEETSKLPINHPDRLAQGRKYYERFLELYGSDHPWVRRYVYAEYADDPSGEAVFKATWRTSFHTAPETLVIPGYPLIVGIDFGRNPWALICQVDHTGRLLVHEEVPAINIGLEKQVEERLRPRLYSNKFMGAKVVLVGDPAGAAKGTIAEETSFDALKRMGLSAFPAPTNDIDARLRAVETLLARNVAGKAALVINAAGCPFLVRAMAGGYRFKRNREGGLRAIPEKFDAEGWSHVCFVAGTSVATPAGAVPIETLRAGDEVCTPIGPRRVIATGRRAAHTVECLFSNNTRTRCTLDHPFWTDRGWIAAADLTTDDTCFALPELLRSEQRHDIRSLNSRAGAITAAVPAIGTTRGPASISIKRSGNAILGLFPKATTFITRMATTATTILRTWNACLRASIIDVICLSQVGSKSPSLPWRLPAQPCLPSGELIRSGPAAFARQPVRSWLPNWPASQSRRLSASTVAAHTGPMVSCASEDSVRHAARARSEGLPALTTNGEHASNAAVNSASTNTQELLPVRPVAVEKSEPANVYNIAVEDAHCYYANGLLVSNCDCLQYVALTVNAGSLFQEFVRRAGRKPGQQQRYRPAVTAAGWT
jgi:hypothetical protein